MVSAFNQYLVQPGLIERSFSHAFGFELNRRIIADYEEGRVDTAAAAHAIESAQAFVGAIRVMMDSTIRRT